MSKPHETQTATRLLDAAERLFASKGWAGASIREITQDAGVNGAAAHYHFGSKQDLLAAVIQRHLVQITSQRLALLDAAEADGPADLERIVEAFVLPILTQAEDPERGASLLRLVGRTFGDTDGPWRSACRSAEIEVTRSRFAAAIARRCPELSPMQVLWRLQFLMGALVHVVLHGDLISEVSQGALDPGDLSAVRGELIAFLTGGLSAPPPA